MRDRSSCRRTRARGCLGPDERLSAQPSVPTSQAKSGCGLPSKKTKPSCRRIGSALSPKFADTVSQRCPAKHSPSARTGGSLAPPPAPASLPASPPASLPASPPARGRVAYSPRARGASARRAVIRASSTAASKRQRCQHAPARPQPPQGIDQASHHQPGAPKLPRFKSLPHRLSIPPSPAARPIAVRYRSPCRSLMIERSNKDDSTSGGGFGCLRPQRT